MKPLIISDGDHGHVTKKESRHVSYPELVPTSRRNLLDARWLVVRQLEKHTPAAAKATIDFEEFYGAPEEIAE